VQGDGGGRAMRNAGRLTGFLISLAGLVATLGAGNKWW
jgi:hypothetical protein